MPHFKFLMCFYHPYLHLFQALITFFINNIIANHSDEETQHPNLNYRVDDDVSGDLRVSSAFV